MEAEDLVVLDLAAERLCVPGPGEAAHLLAPVDPPPDVVADLAASLALLDVSHVETSLHEPG